MVELLEGHGRRFLSELPWGICPGLLCLPWCYAPFLWFVLLARGSLGAVPGAGMRTLSCWFCAGSLKTLRPGAEPRALWEAL